MNREVRVDPDSLRYQSVRLAELGDQVGQTYTGLRDALAYADGCWGDDDMGLAFAKDFKPNTDKLLANLRSMAESLHDMANGINTAANDFEAQDAIGAGRIADSSDPLDPIGGTPTGPSRGGRTDMYSPGNGAGTGPFAGAESGTAPGDPLATSAGARDRTRPAEQASPGGSRSPDGSRGRSAPQDGAQGSDPSTDAAGRRGGEERTEQPGRRSPSSAVSPPATARNVPRAPDAAATRGGGPTVSGGRGGTPWSGRSPSAPGGPAATTPSSPSNPRSVSPPRTKKPTEERQRGPERRRPDERAGNAVLGWLARSLVERHGVQVTGFDTPGLQEPAVREFVAAVDRVLTDYPVISVDVVAIADLEDRRRVRWSSESRGDPTRVEKTITLDGQAARELGVAETSQSEGEPEVPAVYAATLREFGRALDFAGGGVARRTAQHVLIAEYMHRMAGKYTTLAELVRGYRRWRAELTGDSAGASGFDASRALGAAFADVVVRGGEASVQARTLHGVLVDATTRRR
ncbi:hypothetical protein ACQPXH_20520 [Nocardia sp. CA-135953]|uniref:WXG100 family type VII secretion target n=1 Tax=Nocardia sp. CA-135953 TaxID=3239978 RepID=UPI003D95C8AD